MIVEELAATVAAGLANPPSGVRRERLINCLLDWTGVAVAGATEPVARHVADHVRRHRPGDAADLIAGGRVALGGSVLANGVSGHALDYDDTHLGYWGHPSATVMPTALALGQNFPCDGASLLMAIEAGIETSCRMGMMMGSSHRDAGWHATAVSGIFGSAATAAVISGLAPEMLPHVFALCAVQASGLSSAFGSDAKPFQVGRAAELGLEACQLAASGLEASLDMIEGAAGMARAYSFATSTLPRATEPATRGILFKLSPACFGVQAPVVAAQRLSGGFDRGAPPGVVEVEIPPAFLAICARPRPMSITEARFSIPFLVALTLNGHDPSGAQAISAELLVDGAIAALADKVRVTGNPLLGASEAIVRLGFTDGRSGLTAAVDMAARGEDAMMEERGGLVRKFRRNCDPHLGHARASLLCETLVDMERLEDCSVLLRMMALA